MRSSADNQPQIRTLFFLHLLDIPCSILDIPNRQNELNTQYPTLNFQPMKDRNKLGHWIFRDDYWMFILTTKDNVQ